MKRYRSLLLLCILLQGRNGIASNLYERSASYKDGQGVGKYFYYGVSSARKKDTFPIVFIDWQGDGKGMAWSNWACDDKGLIRASNPLFSLKNKRWVFICNILGTDDFSSVQKAMDGIESCVPRKQFFLVRISGTGEIIIALYDDQKKAPTYSMQTHLHTDDPYLIGALGKFLDTLKVSTVKGSQERKSPKELWEIFHQVEDSSKKQKAFEADV